MGVFPQFLTGAAGENQPCQLAGAPAPPASPSLWTHSHGPRSLPALPPSASSSDSRARQPALNSGSAAHKLCDHTRATFRSIPPTAPPSRGREDTQQAPSSRPRRASPP